MDGVETKVRARIGERGPLPFSEVMELALYDPDDGFYATGGRAGRRGDFITSPEVGPLFGTVVARALDAWWRAAGAPNVMTVVDAGAGPGALARSVLAAVPACREALHYVMVERSAAQRALHVPFVDRRPRVESRADLPDPEETEGMVVVVANELLDNLPFDLAERTASGWAEVRAEVVGGQLAEVQLPLDRPDLEASLGQGPPGARVPVQLAAQRWLGQALALGAAVAGGRVVVFDYMSTTAALAERPQHEWLRTYRRHGRGSAPFEHLGEQDITCEVALDQLAHVAPPTAVSAQHEWLRAHGIDELVEEGRATWRERAHLGDLQAVRGRSRITEAEALLDPAGLGAFTVAEWVV